MAPASKRPSNLSPIAIKLVPWADKWNADVRPTLFITTEIAARNRIDDKIKAICTTVVPDVLSHPYKCNGKTSGTRGCRTAVICRVINDGGLQKVLRSSSPPKNGAESRKKKKKSVKRNDLSLSGTFQTPVIDEFEENRDSTCENHHVSNAGSPQSITSQCSTSQLREENESLPWCPQCCSTRSCIIRVGANEALYTAIGCNMGDGFSMSLLSDPPICYATLSFITPDDLKFPPSASRLILKIEKITNLTEQNGLIKHDGDNEQKKRWSIFDELQTSVSQKLLHGTLINILVAEVLSNSSVTIPPKVIPSNSFKQEDGVSSDSIPTNSLASSSSNACINQSSPTYDNICHRCSISYPPLFRIDESTSILVRPPLKESSGLDPPPFRKPLFDGKLSESNSLVGLSRVGGLAQVVQELKDLFLTPLMFPNIFVSFGISPPKGVLLYGPPGTGKTLLAKSLIEEIEVRWEAHWRELGPRFANVGFHQTASFDQESPNISLPPPPPLIEILTAGDVLGGDSRGEEGGEVGVYALFKRCRERLRSTGRGSLIFIDEIDALCPDRERSGEVSNINSMGKTHFLLRSLNQKERRIVSTFLTNLDGLAADSRIVLLAATNRLNAIDPALRRAGRLDREIEVDVPNGDDRVAILLKLLEPVHHSLSVEEITQIAWDCQAFVGADLKCLCTLAALKAIEEHSEMHHDGQAVRTARTSARITLGHFLEALKSVRPSAMKSVSVEIPKVLWSDIGGYETVKQKLQECVEWPIKYRHVFQQLKVVPPRGLLLYGPPGCAKTLLAKAVATESKMNFIAVKGPELFSKYVGESEKAVRDVFRKARQNSPCVIFFDEVDSVGCDRETSGSASGVESRVLSQMLNEMDGIGTLKQVIVIGATNRPDFLDAALLRPGRLDRLVYVPLPDLFSRERVFEVHLRHLPLQKLSGGICPVLQSTSTDPVPSSEDFSVLKKTDSVLLGHTLSDVKWCLPTAHDEFLDYKLPEAEIVEFNGSRLDGSVPAPSSQVMNRFDHHQRKNGSSVGNCLPQQDEVEGLVENHTGEIGETSHYTFEIANEDERSIFMRELAKRTEGYSGAELAMVCREAAMMALRERVEILEHSNAELLLNTVSACQSDHLDKELNKKKCGPTSMKVMITWRHMMLCLNMVKPRIPLSLIAFYENYQNKIVEPIL